MSRVPSIRELARVLREDHGHWFWGHERITEKCLREALGGHCAQAAKALAELTGGTYVRGTYHGDIVRLPGGPFWELSEEYRSHGYHGHSWVEKDGMILDPTWWAFIGAKPAIYSFPVTDMRYRAVGDVRRK